MTVPSNGVPALAPLPGHLSDLGSRTLGEPSDTAAARRRLRQRLREVLVSELPKHLDTTAAGSRAEREALAREILDEAVRMHSEQELMANRALVTKDAEQQVITEVINEVFGMAGLQPLLEDPGVETINVNRFDRVFVQYHDGRRAQLAPIAASNEELTDLVRMLAARTGSEERRFDRGAPSVNVQLPGGERLFAVMALTSGGVTALSIRRHGYRSATLAQLRALGTLDAGLEHFLRALVRARKNIVITGGTGSGKTTLLRGLASEMDPMERIVTIEDVLCRVISTPGHGKVRSVPAGHSGQIPHLNWGLLKRCRDRAFMHEVGPVDTCLVAGGADRGLMIARVRRVRDVRAGGAGRGQEQRGPGRVVSRLAQRGGL